MESRVKRDLAALKVLLLPDPRGQPTPPRNETRALWWKRKSSTGQCRSAVAVVVT
jgi:hypothetical protein